MGTAQGWMAFGVCLVLLLADDTSSSPLRDTDTHSHLGKALNRLEKMFDMLQSEIRDLPSAEEADLLSAKEDQHERDISVPFPEVDETPAKKSSMPAPAPAQSKDKATSTDTPSDGVIEHPVVPTTKKDLSVAELRRLLKILQKRDYGRCLKSQFTLRVEIERIYHSPYTEACGVHFSRKPEPARK
ncbi:hypothetical protein NP493_949g00022 [Ridgeia piscesae]|uniref:Uncharacterized protein n=1 Tax=Ridgeia piscesae TaxID=27915 RepID=A0AAD9KLF3_RIDPI|nr:hypothetical protein NP493_949g00022 [Ridgeia piscesae]